jgi:hypothetical protein
MSSFIRENEDNGRMRKIENCRLEAFKLGSAIECIGITSCKK